MKASEMSRMQLFGILVLMYGVFMLIGSAIDSSIFGDNLSDRCLAVGGLLMTVGGVYAIFRSDVKITNAIGVFAITYGAFKAFRAYADGGDYWIIPFALAVPFMIMGYRYLRGTERSIVTSIFWCVVYAFVDIAYVVIYPNTLNVIDIFILGVFVSILASRDVLVNTTLKRNYDATRIEIHGRARADINLLKALLDAMGDWAKQGSDVGRSKIRDSLDEHEAQVAKVLEAAYGLKRKREFHLNKMETPVEETK